MPTCPGGHPSANDDYCDVCGALIGGEPTGSSTPTLLTCTRCGTPRSGRFCEACGNDSDAPTAPAGWVAVIEADRAYYDTNTETVAFPAHCPQRIIPLNSDEIRVGRASRTRGTVPEIDLSAPPADVGVSHAHAVLHRRPDGTWMLRDPGSTNGTRLNGATEPIAAGTEVAVVDGDRIHIGAWTTITLRSRP